MRPSPPLTPLTRATKSLCHRVTILSCRGKGTMSCGGALFRPPGLESRRRKRRHGLPLQKGLSPGSADLVSPSHLFQLLGNAGTFSRGWFIQSLYYKYLNPLLGIVYSTIPLSTTGTQAMSSQVLSTLSPNTCSINNDFVGNEWLKKRGLHCRFKCSWELLPHQTCFEGIEVLPVL